MILAGDYVPKGCSVRLELPPEEAILCNLEAPIIGSAAFAPILKAGPNLRNEGIGISGRRFIFSLANNHLMDFGLEGMQMTRTILMEHSIPFSGAGETLEDARRPVIYEEAGKRIAIFSCCEKQFGTADHNRGGVAAMGLWLLDAIPAIHKTVDFVVVSCHAALESSPWPSPDLREFYHRLVKAGADVIHGHHAHVPQGFEKYRHGVIFYGLGNFAVVPSEWNFFEHHLWSEIVRLDFRNREVAFEIDFVELSEGEKNEIVVCYSDASTRLLREEYLGACNASLIDDNSCQAYWQEACLRHFDRLYGVPLHAPLANHRLTMRQRFRCLIDMNVEFVAVLLGDKRKSYYSVQRSAAFFNMFHCRSHVDAIECATGVLVGEIPDLRTPQTAEAASSYML